MIHQKKLSGQLTSRRRLALYLLIVLLSLGLGLLARYAYQQGQKSVQSAPPTELADARLDVGPVSPGFDVIRVTKEGRAVIAGRAEPGAKVVLKSGDVLLGETIADKRGDWVLIPANPLPTGAQVITLTAEKGGAPVLSKDSAIISVPERQDGEVFVAISRPGSPTRILDQGQPKAPQPGVSVAGVDMAAGGKSIFSGRAEPGGQVRVYLDNHLVGETAADSNGDWSVNLDQSLGVGPHILRVDQIDAFASVQMRSEVAFSRTEAGRLVIGERQVVVLKGNALWEIARNIYGSGLAYSVIFTNNSGQIRDPDLIYPGQVLRLPGEAGQNDQPEGEAGPPNTIP